MAKDTAAEAIIFGAVGEPKCGQRALRGAARGRLLRPGKD